MDPNTATYVSQYQQESENNNQLAARLLNQVFPGVFDEENTKIYLQIFDGLKLIEEQSGVGCVEVFFKRGLVNLKVSIQHPESRINLNNPE